MARWHECMQSSWHRQGFTGAGGHVVTWQCNVIPAAECAARMAVDQRDGEGSAAALSREVTCPPRPRRRLLWLLHAESVCILLLLLPPPLLLWIQIWTQMRMPQQLLYCRPILASVASACAAPPPLVLLLPTPPPLTHPLLPSHMLCCPGLFNSCAFCRT
jgi:hypothetical protein